MINSFDAANAQLGILAQLGGFGASTQRFFTPTDLFWALLQELHETEPWAKAFIDVGTGLGDLVREGQAHGLEFQGIDSGESQNPEVTVCAGELWTYSPSTLALVCRPCHSGFAHRVLVRVRECNGHLAYVGLPSNRLRDMGHAKYWRAVSNVGQEGESIYFYR